MPQPLRSAAALLTVLAVGLAGALTAAPADAARPRSTVITLVARDCPGCTIQLVQAKRGQVRSWHTKRKTTGADGAVAFRVPTSRTKGMSMMMVAPWEGEVGAVTGVVMRYDGLAVGSVVAASEATARNAGSGCWAGTHKKQVTLQIGTAAVTVPAAYSDGTAQMLVAWMSPQVQNRGHLQALEHGAIALQDYLFC